MNAGAGLGLVSSTTKSLAAAPGHLDRQAEAAVLVDHVHDLKPLPTGVGVEMEAHGPHLMGMHSPVMPH